MNEEFTLMVPFDDDSESFALGFEAGKVFGQCGEGVFPESCTVHSKNKAILTAIVTGYGRIPTFQDIDEDWCVLSVEEGMNNAIEEMEKSMSPESVEESDAIYRREVRKLKRFHWRLRLSLALIALGCIWGFFVGVPL